MSSSNSRPPWPKDTRKDENSHPVAQLPLQNKLSRGLNRPSSYSSSTPPFPIRLNYNGTSSPSNSIGDSTLSSKESRFARKQIMLSRRDRMKHNSTSTSSIQTQSNPSKRLRRVSFEQSSNSSYTPFSTMSHR
ncbi:uncharacterized protein G2W53_003509 [Senna tora]|uniref:Uncharacterized protein n=1 Tax=Senna tora TaxID=362788 RepID=A0A835CFU0_9FABA|nr:uncharacterized protein G2W53_003509 [Senna tora]